MKNSFAFATFAWKLAVQFASLNFHLAGDVQKRWLGQLSSTLLVKSRGDCSYWSRCSFGPKWTFWSRKRRFRHAGYGYFIYVYEGKKKLQLNFRSNILLKRFPLAPTELFVCKRPELLVTFIWLIYFKVRLIMWQEVTPTFYKISDKANTRQ